MFCVTFSRNAEFLIITMVMMMMMMMIRIIIINRNFKRAINRKQVTKALTTASCCNSLEKNTVADLEGAEPGPPPPLGRRTDAVTHGHVS